MDIILKQLLKNLISMKIFIYRSFFFFTIWLFAWGNNIIDIPKSQHLFFHIQLKEFKNQEFSQLSKMVINFGNRENPASNRIKSIKSHVQIHYV